MPPQVQPATYYNTIGNTNTTTAAETFQDETYEDVDPNKMNEDANTDVTRCDNATVVCENKYKNSSHCYDNSPAVMNSQHKQNMIVYENVPQNGSYEPLNRGVYENTKNLTEYKCYTGLDNSKRHYKI